MSTSSYGQIFKSTSLIGGSQIIRMVIGVVQVKALALLLGPAGIGLAGLYQSAIGVIGSIAGLGIGQAGVRQIAEAAGTGDEDRIARTIKTLRRTSLISGIVAMLVAMALCVPLSHATFGNADYAWGIALVSLTLLFGGVSAGQTALLQGLRRLKDLAKCIILGAAFGAVASVTLVYFLREKGVAAYIVAIAAFGVLTSWWYARKISVKKIQITWREMGGEARALLGLGMAFMSSALMLAGSTYLIRILIMHQLDMDAVGFYTASVTLSSLYVGMILGAMGADFYPRLTGVASDHAAVNRLVNEQTEMGLLMALPGILATLVFAPWILRILYSEAFVGAADIIRWQILGIGLRVASWPMGYVLLAKGAARMFMLTEFLFNALHVGLIYLCLRAWGLEGTGIAFFLMYVAYAVGLLAVCGWMTGFAWSRRSWKLILPSGVAVGLLFCAIRLLPEGYGLAAGLLLTVLSAVACFHFLQKLLNINLAKAIVSKLKKKAPTS